MMHVTKIQIFFRKTQVFVRLLRQNTIYTEFYIYLDGSYTDKSNKSFMFKRIYKIDAVTLKGNNPQGNQREGLMGVFKQQYPELEK